MNIIKIDSDTFDFIQMALEEPIMSEDDTLTFTTSFGDGVEMDVKVCGAEDDFAWTEAVLFQYGAEVACTDVEDDILGIWELEFNGKTFSTNVEVA